MLSLKDDIESFVNQTTALICSPAASRRLGPKPKDCGVITSFRITGSGGL
jgi:hypothetical protein